MLGRDATGTALVRERDGGTQAVVGVRCDGSGEQQANLDAGPFVSEAEPVEKSGCVALGDGPSSRCWLPGSVVPSDQRHGGPDSIQCGGARVSPLDQGDEFTHVHATTPSIADVGKSAS